MKYTKTREKIFSILVVSLWCLSALAMFVSVIVLTVIWWRHDSLTRMQIFKQYWEWYVVMIIGAGITGLSTIIIDRFF